MQVPPDAGKRITELIAQIQTERDPVRFTSLVEELNRLLDEKAQIDESRSVSGIREHQFDLVVEVH
jgi:hypothetical protein